MLNILLSSKSNQTLYKTYKLIFKYKKYNKYYIIKLGIYNPGFNIISCIYYILLKYLKYGIILNKKILKILIYKIKKYKIK
nr:hypothetical protein [Plasmodium sp.]